MDFAFSEQHEELARLTRTILADFPAGVRFDRPLWKALAKAGVLSAALPESVGGSGLGLLEQCGVLVELGSAVAQVPYLASITQAASAIAEFGTAEQRDRWARPAANGELVLTVALTEDPSDPPTRAEPDGDGWRLSGTKVTVPAGPIADLVLVPAETPDGAGVFLVTPADPGFVLHHQEIVDGDGEGLLELDGVPLAADRLLDVPGGGTNIVEWLTARGTVGLCALQAGVTATALRMTADYASSRVQFDRPIATFQAVGQRLADCYIDVEGIRLTLWQAAWRLSQNLAAHNEVAAAKFWAAEGGHRVAHAAVHVHGGLGIDVDYPLHRYFVASKRFEFSLGGATTQLRRIGMALAAEPA